jgi:predicted naringenin-chalcone synthase
MPVFLSRPVLCLPDNCYPQEQIKEFMLSEPGITESGVRKIQSVYKESGIGFRYSVSGGFGKPDSPGQFRNDPTPARMEVYEKEALILGTRLVQKMELEFAEVPDFSLQSITHLVWVSCTGLVAPGHETGILNHFSFHPDVQATAFNFLGCHGFFHALRYASSVVRSQPEAKVLVLCVELCTLHFKSGDSEDQLLANSLFGDGAAGVLVSGKETEIPSVQILKQSQSYFADSASRMAWTLGEHGFDMRLSRKLPVAVASHIRETLEKLVAGTETLPLDFGAWIFHPGGKRILDLLQSTLGLTDGDLFASREALRLVGNVSSGSVLFALRQFMDQSTRPVSKPGIMLGIGPGLAMESALFVI